MWGTEASESSELFPHAHRYRLQERSVPRGQDPRAAIRRRRPVPRGHAERREALVSKPWPSSTTASKRSQAVGAPPTRPSGYALWPSTCSPVLARFPSQMSLRLCCSMRFAKWRQSASSARPTICVSTPARAGYLAEAATDGTGECRIAEGCAGTTAAREGPGASKSFTGAQALTTSANTEIAAANFAHLTEAPACRAASTAAIAARSVATVDRRARLSWSASSRRLSPLSCSSSQALATRAPRTEMIPRVRPARKPATPLPCSRSRSATQASTSSGVSTSCIPGVCSGKQSATCADGGEVGRALLRLCIILGCVVAGQRDKHERTGQCSANRSHRRDGWMRPPRYLGRYRRLLRW